MISRLQSVLACTLIAHLFAVLLLAASPELHEKLHSDAGHEGHECAVALFASGSCENPCSSPVISEQIEFITANLPSCARDYVPSCFLAGRILEHAPPALA